MIEELRALKQDKTEDNIRYKEIIKSRLYKNPYIIHCIHSPNLSEDAPDGYIGTHIKPALIVPETQTNPMSYICFKVDFDERVSDNKFIKIGLVSFTVLVDHRDLIDTETGIARHDLLAALVRREFNHTNIFGNQLVCVSDKEATTDTSFALRTLVFELRSPNDVLRNGRVSNNEVRR